MQIVKRVAETCGRCKVCSVEKWPSSEASELKVGIGIGARFAWNLFDIHCTLAHSQRRSIRTAIAHYKFNPTSNQSNSAQFTMSSLSSTTNPLTGAPSSANHKRIRAQAKELPVSQCMDRLMEAIKKNVVTIVVAETGSGKTTQIPLQIMLQLMPSKSDKKLALTQPRRLAAQHVRRIGEAMT